MTKTGELNSIPVHPNAVIAQLVECHLAKVKVAGSSPVYRSIYIIVNPQGRHKHTVTS